MIQIKNLSGAVLFESTTARTVRAAVEEAVAAGIALRGADFRGADFRWAVFGGAVFRGADFRGGDFRGTGLVHLPVSDPRGYCAVADGRSFLEGPGGAWRILAGCRNFSVPEAVAHWGAADYPDRARGDAYLFALGCLAHVPPPAAP